MSTEEIATRQNAEATNWAGTRVGAAIAYTVIAVEASPIPLNEGLRVAAGAWGYNVSQGNSMVAATCAGLATIAIEGGAAIAAADLLDTTSGKKATNFIRDKMTLLGIKDGIKTNTAVDASIALLGGSAVVTAVKHQQDPSRSRSANRKYGLASAGGLTALTFAETYAIANGFEHPNPGTIAVGALAVGAFMGTFKWAKNKLQKGEATYHTVAEGETPHRLMPSEEDINEALADPRSLVVEDNNISVPVLMPADKTHWYNIPYLKKRFGTNKLYSYMYPSIEDEDTQQDVYKSIHEIIESGGVVLYGVERVGSANYGDLGVELAAAGLGHSKVSTGPEGQEKFLPQYDGQFTVRGVSKKENQFKTTPLLHDVFRQAVADGKIKFDPNNGPALADVIDGDEADRLWEIYQKPFAKLSQKHPITVGYSNEEFRAMLADPLTVKAVYRQNGEIATMAFFVNDLGRCDWLDAEYYAKKYPEATATKNHWVFPGIVTDEKKKGERLSMPLLSLVAKVQAMTGSAAIISFECTEESSKYVPRIASLAINKSMAAKIDGGFIEVSRLEHYAIVK